jgi:hypothetical protein
MLIAVGCRFGRRREAQRDGLSSAERMHLRHPTQNLNNNQDRPTASTREVGLSRLSKL